MWKNWKHSAFPGYPARLQSSVMALFRRYDSEQLVRATSELAARVQRLEEGQAELLARLPAERQFRMFIAHIDAAARVAPMIGESIERFAQAMHAPRPRGRSGGIARARTAWRDSDGTFVSDSERQAAIEKFGLQEYERYATGGRMRARTARRDEGGRFWG
jgi:hypothetical protein